MRKFAKDYRTRILALAMVLPLLMLTSGCALREDGWFFGARGGGAYYSDDRPRVYVHRDVVHVHESKDKKLHQRPGGPGKERPNKDLAAQVRPGHKPSVKPGREPERGPDRSDRQVRSERAAGGDRPVRSEAARRVERTSGDDSPSLQRPEIPARSFQTGQPARRPQGERAARIKKN
jgi:hypothetical protein